MTAREKLHQLVEQLPESEINVAIRILEALEEEGHGLPIYTLENAPVDDEPFDPADLEGIEEEPLIPHEEVARRLLR